MDARTLIQDRPTVAADGATLHRLLYGVTFRDAVTHVDDRGTVCELYDLRWNWHPDPLPFVYMFTIRPGQIKGWGMHKEHEDRYFVQFGELEIVMYDDRPDSPTYRDVSKVVLSEYRRRLMNVPTGVWHANHNIGTKDVVVVNFPTRPYEHGSPDKYRLPIDTDQIPYTFSNTRGW